MLSVVAPARKFSHGQGQTLADRTKPGPSFNCRSGCLCALDLLFREAIRPNLKLKTRPKQLIDSLPLDIALPLKENARVNNSRKRFIILAGAVV
jgi:hypothetical protein